MPAEGCNHGQQNSPPPVQRGGISILRAVIFANGEIQNLWTARSAIQQGDLLIAADGGTRNCLALGLTPDQIIGDLDSLEPEQRSTLETSRTKFRSFPMDKDQTDLELALNFVAQQGADEILLLGLIGGRLDQTLANLLLLSRPEWSKSRLVVIDGLDTAYILHDQGSLSLLGEAGDIVSLLPLCPQVTGVTTHNLKWSLEKSILQFGSTLSVSNQMTAPSAEISILHGTLLVVHRMDETG
jgi:thiamine pyrophosphokinase